MRSHPKLRKAANGYFYIVWNDGKRSHRRSTRSRDRDVAVLDLKLWKNTSEGIAAKPNKNRRRPSPKKKIATAPTSKRKTELFRDVAVLIAALELCANSPPRVVQGTEIRDFLIDFADRRMRKQIEVAAARKRNRSKPIFVDDISDESWAAWGPSAEEKANLIAKFGRHARLNNKP